MDLVAEMLSGELRRGFASEVNVTDIRPNLPRVARRLGFGSPATRLNVDRFLGRFGTYPASVALRRREFDFFHVVDHTYASLVSVLPANRTGVYCHDLNAFEAVIEPLRVPRPAWFRTMARAQLKALKTARLIFVNTKRLAEQLASLGIADPSRIVWAPLGAAEEFRPGVPLSVLPESIRRSLEGHRYVLHVGSSIPRKRLDVLFEVFHELRRQDPDLQLVQQGGALSEAQLAHLSRLRLSIVQPPRLSREQLSALYGHASLVLLPSEDEGFGLPVIEALACGAPVVASDLPTLREAGGENVSFCSVGDVPQWVRASAALLGAPGGPLQRSARENQAAQFTWANHARIIWQTYASL
jgi:glycosyltransferase involved in cell wall biosynthesis